MPQQNQRVSVRTRQNPAKDWQMWLRRGCLCVAKGDMQIRSWDDEESGFPVALSVSFTNKATKYNSGDLVIYAGELRRRLQRGHDKKAYTEVTHYFFSPKGFFIAEPDGFADASGENKD